MAPSSGTAQWSSRLAFILAAVGCSVGLGNLWRFSAEAGANGGGAFVAVYLACVIIIGIPTLMSEFIIGRAGNAASSVNSIEDLSQRSGMSRFWNVGMWVGMFGSFFIISFYAVVAAWVMAYIPRFITGAFDNQTPEQIAAQFDQLVVSPNSLMLWFLIFCGLVIWLVARGLNRGIELASKVLMPTFFALLLALSIYSVITSWESGGTREALNFMFNPDFSKITGKVMVSALGQAFFSIGLGMAMMVAYGSYLPKNISLPNSAFVVGLSDTMVALIAGFAIFPIVFKFGLDFQAGAGLFFQTLPTALISAPGGNIIGAAFFCMAFFAALTTGVAMLEVPAAYVAEQFNLTKAKAAIYMGIAMVAVGFVCLYSMDFLNFLDGGLTAPILLPVSALMVVLFVGWRLDRAIIEAEFTDEDRKLGNFLLLLVRYVAPVMIALILFAGVRDKYFPTLFAG
ncbi:MAG: sodium-dependent transporter [Pseudomonadota bacterium]